MLINPGIVAAERIVKMQTELDIQIENAYLILNRVLNGVPQPLQERIDQLEVPFLGAVPSDNELLEFEFSRKPLVDLGDNSPVYKAISSMLDQIL